MTDNEMNVAIAEACGWRVVKNPNGKGVKWQGPNKEGSTGGGCYGWGYNDEPLNHDLPNYCADLNAMHVAAKTLPFDLRQKYADLVQSDAYDDFEWIESSAAKRSEAFLRTIGKWKE